MKVFATYLPTYPPTYPPTYLPTYLPTNPTTYPPTHLASYSTTHPHTYLPTYQWWRSNSEFTSFPGPLLFPSPVGRAGLFLRPHPHIPGYFLICNFFLADSNIFTSIPSVQVEFARPHVSEFTLSSSANLLSDPRLMRKLYLYSSSISVLLTKLSHQAPVCSFNLFMASNSSVRHGKKAQIIELPFGIIEVYSNHS